MVAVLLLLIPRWAAAEPAPVNVLLITVDTLRPDALGWVAGRNATPELDALAAQGFRFPAAVSPAPVTQPAHASLFTALVPRRHGVRDNGQMLGKSPATLAERLRASGYATAAFVGGYPLAAEFGFDRGFDHYDDALAAGSEQRLERPAAETTAAALAWAASAPEPWFLWVHYWDPHDPYTPPAAFARPGERGAYHGEVAYVDHAVGVLRRGLAAGLGGEVLTVFTADHGESLGEHGENTHGFFIYESTVAVPMVFHLPGRIAAGESAAAARLVDVAPTLLDLLHQPALAAGVDGVSLASLLSGRPQTVPPAVVESRRPWRSYGWSPLAAVRRGRWKLIAAPRPELYDLERDPGERTNLVHEERRRAGELRDVLRRSEARPAAESRALADSKAMARLESLGYTGAGASPGEPPPGLPDPKDRVELWNALSQAVELGERRDHAAAVARFDAVLAKEPGNPFALSRSAAVLIETGDFNGAIARLRRAVERTPADAESRNALAFALSRTGDHAGAAAEYLELAGLQPRRLDAWVNLANSLGRAGRNPEAIGALARAVELAPDRPDLRIRLAFVQHAAGNVEAAIGHLRLAAEVTGPEAFPHAGALGLLLLRQGQPKEAAGWLGRSRPEEGDFAEARYALARLAAESGDLAAAKRELALAVGAAPALRVRAKADPALAGLLP